MQPACALFSAGGWRNELSDEMNMIWHDDRGRQVVSFTVEMEQRFHHEFGKLAAPQQAVVMARIEMPVPQPLSQSLILKA